MSANPRLDAALRRQVGQGPQGGQAVGGVGMIASGHFPECLISRPQWVFWATRDRDGKPTKVPLSPHGGDGKVNDPTTWGTFDQACAARKDGQGMGFVFTEGDPYCGIDLDSSWEGRFRFCAQVVIDYFGSYTEVSPSGQGIHIIVKAKLPPGRNRQKLPCGMGIEVYDHGRFFTMTGRHLPATPVAVEDRQAEIEALHNCLTKLDKKPQAENSRPGPSPTLDLDDAEIIKRAHEAHDGGKLARLWAGDWVGAGYPSQSEADLALCMKLAFWAGPDPDRIDRLYRQSGLMRPKWNRADYRFRTIDRALAQVTEFYDPHKHNGVVCHGKPDTGPSPCPGIPVWPHGALQGAAQRFADVYSSYLETPRAFLEMAYLTALGHIVADRVALASEVYAQPRLFTILLGESGVTRKSTAITKVLEFFRETLEPGVMNPVYGVGSAEGLAECFKDHNRVLLAIDELKTLIQKMKIDASILLPCINTLFEDNVFHSRTKKHKIKLDNAYLSLLAASTIDTYQNLFNATFTDIGFLNRFFIVIGQSERKFAIPKMIPEDTKKSLRNDLRDILQTVNKLTNGTQYLIPINTEAIDIFEHWYFHKRPYSVFTTRLDALGHRVMVLMAANEGRNIITPEIAERTVKLLEYQYQARIFADPIDADNVIAKVEERIRRLLTVTPRNERDLARLGNKHRVGNKIWREAIKNLIAAREIVFSAKTKLYTLNTREE